ncbi:MAG: GatB/YqeY domain-containing protein [Spirochaetaceae bacterium]|nr:GatB/YqeY domain-containing protein [Spirochaetaceae bacterium]
MTTKEMFKERMTIRKTDPVRASVLGMLIDAVQKNIRELNREETEADIAQAAKKMYDQTEATLAEYKKGGADTAELEAQLAVLKEFVPETLSPEATKAEIQKILDALAPEERILKNIMQKLKAIPGVDMKSAKSIVESLLK